jgi:hypothetical protein
MSIFGHVLLSSEHVQNADRAVSKIGNSGFFNANASITLATMPKRKRSNLANLGMYGRKRVILSSDKENV